MKINHIWKRSFSLALAVPLLYVLVYRVAPAIRYHVRPRPHPLLLDAVEQTAHEDANAITTNLVVASVASDDIAWTSALPIPNLNVLRYIGNKPSAQFHPPVPKGREALMYFTYLYDFYDDLPDISIFVHAGELPWHVEGTLLQNMTVLLSQLDLQQVAERGYFNLRVTWRAACPAWINTSKSFDDWDKMEEPYMKEAWEANFGEDTIPDMLGGPCCSQFAVSREAIHRRPREQYRRSMEWLVQTNWSDSIVGRVWEHLWPRLFTDDASDCRHKERQSLCQMYSICFADDGTLDEYKELWEERERLKEDMSFFRAVWNSAKAAEARRKMNEVGDEIEGALSNAWRNGRDGATKARLLGSGT